jgi:hypothetical protein
MCISCSLHYFIGCSLFGFKFECKFQFKFKSLLFMFSFSLSLSSSLGPAQLATSFLPFFSSPWQPSRGPLSFLFFLLRARPTPRSSPASPRAALLSSPFFFPARAAHRPLPRPIGASTCAPLLPRSLSLPGVWVPPVGPSFPAPNRDSAPSPAPPRDLRPPYPPRAITPRRPRPPYLSRRTPRALSPKPQPPRTLTLASALFAAAVAARTLGHRRAAASRRTTASEASRGGEDTRLPIFSLFPAPPMDARRAPKLTAAPRRRQPPLPLYPLIKFLALPSTSPSRSEPKPTRETHYRVKSGEPPPPPPHHRRPAAASAPSRATSAPPPSDRDPTAPARSKPESNELDTGQPCHILQNSPYVFPESTRTPSQFKSIRILVLFLLFRPL